MKRTIRLSENSIYKMVVESVHKLLTEEELANYEQILQNEYTKAQKDLQSSKSTFHRGIRDALLSMGYTVTAYNDNYIHFYGPSRLFGFRAHEDYGDYRKPWLLSNDIDISFSNYTWKEMYQYPCYYHTRDNKRIKIDEFTAFYQKISEEIGEPLVLKPFKTAYENVEETQKFKVIEWGTRTYNILGEFDNFEEAKEYAYKFADEECKNGKQRNDSTSRYFHSSPIDVTKKFTNYAAAYEYYDYHESTYYVIVEPA